MHSLLAAWRVSLHRTRADWPIVAAAWLIVLLAATLLAAGPIYSSAVSLAGLHRVLEDADVADANIEVTARVDLADAPASLDKVTAELGRGAGTIGMSVVAAGTSDSYALPSQASDQVRDLATFGFIDGIEAHASLLSGAWPTTRGTAPNGPPIEVAVVEQIADALGVQVGTRFPLVSRLDPTQVIDVVFVGMYRPNDPNDPFWWNDHTLLDGITESEQYLTYGPMLTTRQDLLERVAGRTVSLTWHAFPQFKDLTIDQIGPLRTDFELLPEKLTAAIAGGFPVVRTNLVEILDRVGALAPGEQDRDPAADGAAGDPGGLCHRPDRRAHRRPPTGRYRPPAVAWRGSAPDQRPRAGGGAAARDPGWACRPVARCRRTPHPQHRWAFGHLQPGRRLLRVADRATDHSGVIHSHRSSSR